MRDQVAELDAASEKVIVAGDLNAFEDESALTTLEDGTMTLDNLWDTAPAEERYSFAFQGRLQTLDHVLVTDGHHVSDHDPPVLTLSRGNGR